MARHSSSAQVWLGLAFFFALLAGCFKDGGGNDGGGCAEGAMGCACYGNGTCDPDLECREGSCVPSGCTAGDLNCVCVDGQCLGDLSCVDGLCSPPDSDTGETGDGPGDTDTSDSGTTTDSTDSTETGTTQGDSSDTAETDPTDTMGSSSVTTDPTDTMGQTCDEVGDCYECIKCEGAKACQDQWDACEGADPCLDYVDCALGCGGNSNCWSNCKGVAPDSYELGDVLVQCTCELCAQSCGNIIAPACE